MFVAERNRPLEFMVHESLDEAGSRSRLDFLLDRRSRRDKRRVLPPILDPLQPDDDCLIEWNPSSLRLGGNRSHWEEVQAGCWQCLLGDVLVCGNYSGA